MLASIEQRIADTINAKPAQVKAAINLLDDGATVPFIARYRKEVTAGLDDTQLRQLEESLTYMRELEQRREAILASIDEQGKLTDTLKQAIDHADSKARLEDLYLPYKKKRRSKAQKAREAGLEPLAYALRDTPTLDPESTAQSYLNPEHDIIDSKAALDGARAILIEDLAEDASLVGPLREWLWNQGHIHAEVVKGKETEGAKYRDYFDFDEAIAKVPSHRLLAILRGRSEGMLNIHLLPPGDDADSAHLTAQDKIAKHMGFHHQGRASDDWLAASIRLAWRAKLSLTLSLDLIARAREAADDEAIGIFGSNLKDLLLAAPAGAKTVMGLDPGIRTGVKVAVVDETGKLAATATIYPHQPRREWQVSLQTLAKLCIQHKVELIAIGNGTASRETDKLATELIKGLTKQTIAKLVVSEAGASVYSASVAGAREFPDLDVSLRGAVSIARRLQDPLAELVKIEPKAIGVGQYQHDVNPIKLTRALDACVEDCVNAVGVDVNTASASLLSRVAGLSATVAENIVDYRNQHGAYSNRKSLLKVARLGPKAFEQCAGFLRIRDGDNPLDASAVHPEAYPIVERISQQTGRKLAAIIGDSPFLAGIQPRDYTDNAFGLPTIKDILTELDKPGRDPRPTFIAPSFAEGVEDLNDLHVGMILEGRVSNVAAFGAFVDIGVHQDGLVHVSALAHTFVKDPRAIVKAGDIVKVKVMDVDSKRKRISLSMRLDDVPGDTAKAHAASRNQGSSTAKPRSHQGKKPAANPANNALAAAFARAGK